MRRTFEFREIRAADVPELIEVRTRTRENAYTVAQLERLGITVPGVAELLAGSYKGWSCSDGDRIVGFCMGDRATGELWVIAILPEYEGLGIGGGLMDRVEGWLWDCGCRWLWLTTDVDTRLRAYGFYRARGWTDWKVEDGLRWMRLLPEDARRAVGERG